MNKIYSIGLIGILLFVGLVSAHYIVPGQDVRNLEARYSGGVVSVTGDYYDNRNVSSDFGMFYAYCYHNNTQILLGTQKLDGLSYSDKGNLEWIYINSNDTTNCIKGDNVSISFDDWESFSPLWNSTSVEVLYRRHHSNVNPNTNNEVPEFGLIAGALALVGAIGIFMYKRK
jgi:hypothetical protein